MKAVQLVELKRPLRMREVDVPVVGAKDVLVQVKAAGICHSDAHSGLGCLRSSLCPSRWGTKSRELRRRWARR